MFGGKGGYRFKLELFLGIADSITDRENTGIEHAYDVACVCLVDYFALLRRVISDCRERGVKGIVLTCHERLLPFYARFGFKDEGMSTSEHGGSSWHQMRLLF